MGREVIQVRAVLPPPPPPDPNAPLPEIGAESDRITEAQRRAIRLGGLAFATGQPNGVRWTGTASPQGGRGGGHQTYVQWCVRFTRFCLTRLKQTPQAQTS